MISAQTSAKIFGNFDDFAEGISLSGWVTDPKDPYRKDVVVTAVVDGTEVAASFANLPRGDGFQGFHILFQFQGIAELIATGRLKVVARGADGERTELNVYGALLARANCSYLEKNRRQADSIDPAIAICNAIVEADSFCKEINSTKLAQKQVAYIDNLSPILLPVGTTSEDGSAVIGKDGFLFLYRGSNDVVTLYRSRPADPKNLVKAQQWLRVFQSREHLARELGAVFMQMVVPEKSTVLRTYAPADITPITPVYALLDGEFMRQWLKGTYISLSAGLEACLANGNFPFLRTDSHLSDFGVRVIVRNILTAIQNRMPGQGGVLSQQLALIDSLKSEAVKQILAGDLSARFFVPTIYEEAKRLDVSPYIAVAPPAPVVYDISPSHGHNGSRVVWKNDKAPIDLKVIAFANSFFERGADPRGVSWWLKHLFKEYHFIWSPHFDEEYVANNRPDVIICQTIERFLGVVPKS
jgi:hypothetical protein